MTDRHHEARSQALFDYAPDGILIADSQSYYLDANPAMCRMLGYTRQELIGMHAKDIVCPEETSYIEPALRTIHARDEYNREWRFRRKDGTTFEADVMVTVMPDGNLLAIVRDVSERKAAERERHRLEEQLRHAQKLEAVGLLAGGIAHDFNNLLAVIFSYASMLLEDAPHASPMRGPLEHIRHAAERAAALTKQLLAFGRKQMLKPAVIDLGGTVRNFAAMLQRVLGEDVELSIHAAELSKVVADTSQVEQILMNLAVNARDAMPSGGKLRIEVENAELGGGSHAQEPLEPGPYVMLAVSDTGTGMDEATRTRIFEPFFTTKPRGKGTGLGLSTVFGIVKQSQGHIWVYSEPGHGTTFKIYLPRTERSAEPERVREVASGTRGDETILLVEDDDQVRAATRAILTRFGYRVLEAAHGEAAIAQCAQHEGAIHLLLTDVIMPKMHGPEVAKRITALRPQTRVLYMSGYTEGSIVDRGVLDADVAFVPKPTTPEALARKVREVLDGDRR